MVSVGSHFGPSVVFTRNSHGGKHPFKSSEAVRPISKSSVSVTQSSVDQTQSHGSMSERQRRIGCIGQSSKLELPSCLDGIQTQATVLVGTWATDTAIRQLRNSSWSQALFGHHL